jgi:hypothetical protein
LHLPYENVDTVRLALGKAWDYEFNEISSTSDVGSTIFSNDNAALNIFCGAPLQLQACTNADLSYDQNAFEEGTYSQLRQRLVLKTSPTDEQIKEHFNFVSLEDPTEDNVDNFFWAYLMKYGVITDSGNSYDPIVKTGQDYFDHYHEAFAPFTLEELTSQEPAGKAFFANYKIFYNGRSPYTFAEVGAHSYANSEYANKSSLTSYENFIANPDYQNCLPNIYSFLKLTNNASTATEQIFNLDEILDGGSDGVNSLSPGITLKKWYESGGTEDDEEMRQIYNNAYTSLLQRYPLETSLFLYGALSNKDWVGLENDTSWPVEQNNINVDRIINNNQNKTDLNSLIMRWHTNFQNALNLDARLASFSAQPNASGVNRYGLEPFTKLGSLEYINSNFIFSPAGTKNYLQKVDQYKNYFPMYCEIEFSTRILTNLGDALQEYKLGNFLGTQLAAQQDPYGVYPSSENESYFNKFKQDTSDDYEFVDFAQKNVFSSNQASEYISLPASEGDAYVENTKKTIDIINLIDSFINNEDFSSTNQQEFYWKYYNNELAIAPSKAPESYWSEDIRNYTSYIIDDSAEPPTAENACNPIYKALFAPLFRQKLLDVYEEKKRDYIDIVNGVPAYTEDLFYIIKKFKKSPSDLEEANVQNIYIPNTSDLNVAKYVDTQVKYGAYATYRYEVHAARVVFGSRYKYYYTGASKFEQEGGGGGLVEVPGTRLTNLEKVDSEGLLPALTSGVNMQDADSSWSSGLLQNLNGYHATVDVDIYPSIQIIQDKIFSTKEIKILDNPPVPPFVNIVPYRAVNNRIAILLSGQSDTFRQTPVSILESDEENFNSIVQSQFSLDGKIRFSSDDQIAGFQMFRTDKKPSSYSDFSLHPSNPELFGASVGLDDMIMPNKKYYYTFRALDVHGHISNPTPVYEIELIDEKGAVKPLIRTISLETKQNKNSKKDCQKYLMLRPSLKQLYFSDQEGVNNIFSSEDDANKKRFKIRLTSKATGKKIDVNFSFVKKFTDE